MKELKYLGILNRFASIRRGTHPDMKGDRIYNSEYYLKSVRSIDEEFANEVAEDITQNMQEYSDQTRLPERSLIHAVKYLTGEWK